MRTLSPLFSLLLLIGLLSPVQAATQEVESEAPHERSRPKIGLVLKGGGALGLAHVGVLKVLEENRVPIDYIAGTSIGSIVGAAYASGTTVEDMERILNETDWNVLFGEKIYRENVEYRSKGGRNRELFGEGKIGIIDGKPVIPRGVVTGENIRILFQQMFGYPPSPLDFDTLPIPFRAITADAETGLAFIPASGDLATVVRASMSIPGAFSPVEIDGKLLVDGGIANNLPVDVALEMGSDILIVIDLISTLATREELQSPFAITGQVISLLLMQNAQLSRKLVRSKDIVIEPDVSGFAVSDFPRGKELMAIGADAARAQEAQLKQLSLSEEQYARFLERRTRRIPTPERIDFVRINNRSIFPDQQITEKLTIKPGDTFDASTLDENVQRIFQTGQFESVQYSIVREGESSGIQVDAKGKGWLDQYIRVGFALEDDLRGDNQFRLGVAFRDNNVTNKGSYFEAIGEIGATPRVSAELYQPLYENSPYFIAPKFFLGDSTLNVRLDDTIVGEYNRTEGIISTAVGRRIASLGETSFSYSRGYGDLSRRIGDASLPDFGYDLGDLSWRMDLDNLDKVDFPTRGFRIATRVNAAIDELGASGGDFQEFAGGFSLPISSDRNTLVIRNTFASTFGDRPVQRYYSLGGFLTISGTLQQSLPASNYNTGSLVFFRRFSEVDNPFFDLAFFGGGSYELTTLHSYNPNFKSYSLINSGSVFVGADTPLLPVYFGFGLADTGDHSFYILIGRIGLPDR